MCFKSFFSQKKIKGKTKRDKITKQKIREMIKKLKKNKKNG